MAFRLNDNILSSLNLGQLFILIHILVVLLSVLVQVDVLPHVNVCHLLLFFSGVHLEEL